MTYDPEATYQEADILEAEMFEVAATLFRAEKAGQCTHQSAVGYIPPPAVFTAQVGLKPGQVRCTSGCGQVFNSDDDWMAAIRWVLEGEWS